jgi:hypothetical protein
LVTAKAGNVSCPVVSMNWSVRVLIFHVGLSATHDAARDHFASQSAPAVQVIGLIGVACSAAVMQPVRPVTRSRAAIRRDPIADIGSPRLARLRPQSPGSEAGELFHKRNGMARPSGNDTPTRAAPVRQGGLPCNQLHSNLYLAGSAGRAVGGGVGTRNIRQPILAGPPIAS